MARTFAAISTDVVKVTQQSAINAVRPITISLWVAIKSLPGAGTTVLIGKSAAIGVAGTGSIVVYVGGIVPRIFFVATSWGTSLGQWRVPIPTQGIGVWHHVLIAYQYAATTDDPVMYVDGVSQAVVREVTPAGALQTDSSDMFFGNSDAGDLAFDGEICEIAIWNVILSASEIAQLASVPGAAADELRAELTHLKGYWPLSPYVQLSPEPDWSGNGNASSLITGTTFGDHAPVTRIQGVYKAA